MVGRKIIYQQEGKYSSSDKREGIILDKIYVETEVGYYSYEKRMEKQVRYIADIDVIGIQQITLGQITEVLTT